MTRRPLCLDDLKSGIVESGDSGISSDEIPPWYDHDKFLRGQTFFRKHVASITFAMHLSLLSGLSITNLIEPLVFSKASNTPEKSLKRYVMTFYHILLWMTCDVWDKNSKAYTSLKTVRGMHNHTSKAMNKYYHHKLFVSQYDMALVQSGFFAAVIMRPGKFGIKCTLQELEDYTFTWRVIGYLLGVKDKYNICSQNNYIDTYNLCQEIVKECLIPSLLHPAEQFDNMADAYINGINLLFPVKFHSKMSSLALFSDIIFAENKIRYPMTFCDWIKYYFWKCFLGLLYYCAFIKRLMNNRILAIYVRNVEQFLGREVSNQISSYVNT